MERQNPGAVSGLRENDTFGESSIPVPDNGHEPVVDRNLTVRGGTAVAERGGFEPPVRY